jgi:hypothetical protein
MLADTDASHPEPLQAPTVIAFRILLTDHTSSDVLAIVQTLARVLPEQLPRCIPLFVVVGHDPRQLRTLAHLPTIDYPDPRQPLVVQPMATPQIIYRGSNRLGLGDIYRIALPLAHSLDAHLIVSDADRQIDAADCVQFGRWVVQESAENDVECYGVPQRVVRNFTRALDRKVEEDLMNCAVRLAVAESIGPARLRKVWVGSYPIRDAQSSLFVLSRGAVRAVLEDGVVSSYLNAFGPHEPLWGGDLIVQYGAVCAAARYPERMRIVTRPIVPAPGEGHSTINLEVLRQKWREAAYHLGANLQRVKGTVCARPGDYLQSDVLAEISYDRRQATELVRRVCRKLCLGTAQSRRNGDAVPAVVRSNG